MDVCLHMYLTVLGQGGDLQRGNALCPFRGRAQLPLVLEVRSDICHPCGNSILRSNQVKWQGRTDRSAPVASSPTFDMTDLRRGHRFSLQDHPSDPDRPSLTPSSGKSSSRFTFSLAELAAYEVGLLEGMTRVEAVKSLVRILVGQKEGVYIRKFLRNLKRYESTGATGATVFEIGKVGWSRRLELFNRLPLSEENPVVLLEAWNLGVGQRGRAGTSETRRGTTGYEGPAVAAV